MRSEKTSSNKDSGRSLPVVQGAAAHAVTLKESPRARQQACNVGDGAATLSDVEQRQMIERLAYLRAERRGFKEGSPEEDWLAAEAEVRSSLAA